jgi:hypothetical protein
MGQINNPYPKLIRDEDSGIEVPNKRYDDWESGYRAGLADAVCSDFDDSDAALKYKNRDSKGVADRV